MNTKKFIFAAFDFSDFNVQCPNVYIKRGDILSDESSEGIIPSITPERNKQTALAKTSVTLSSCYFPHRPVMSGFIDIFYKWWTIANSKH